MMLDGLPHHAAVRQKSNDFGADARMHSNQKNVSSVSGPGLFRMRSGTKIFPTS